ncbi:MAG: chitobiase/beta-hexosaminidase C-terminal domain-containing protein [Deltaproteobacteria bacterium]|nr:chitobiase/beta-hexosaminidase C-terminal domain-containing protein [Deltaproteobacteria bacterium]
MQIKTFAFAAALMCFGSPVALAQVAQTGMVCSQPGMQCRYWLPSGYDANKKYPLILYFHGAGQSGTNNRSQVEDWGAMPQAYLERRAKYPAFFVAPQAPSAEGNDRWVNWDWGKGSYDVNAVAESASMKKAMAILASLRGQYSIDPDRIYVMGESMGGFGTWDALARHPDVFAAGVPADGGGSPQAAGKLKDMAIFSAHFENDGAVPVSSDREMFKAVAAAGGRPTFMEIGGPGHGVAGTFCSNDVHYDWLFAQRHGVPPSAPLSQVTFTPSGGPIGTQAMVTISTSLEKPTIRYTLNGDVPTASTGTIYTQPIKIDKNTILRAAVFSTASDDFSTTVYHAASYTLGNAPAGQGGSGAGGSMAGAGGSAGAGGMASGGMAGSVGTSQGGGAGSVSGRGGSDVGGAGGKDHMGGEGGDTVADENTSSSGCALARRHGNGPWLVVIGLAVWSLRRQRRR